MLENFKKVILKKPATFKVEEIIELKKFANKNKIILLEATKSIHVKELKIIEDFTKNNKVNLAVFNLNQYSSRMSDVYKVFIIKYLILI